MNTKLLLLSALFISSLTQAQVVIFSQMDNLTSGIIATMQNGGSDVVWSADDFEVTAPYQLSKITVKGFDNSLSFENLVQGFNFYIYTNDNGKPSGDPTNGGGTALLSFTTTNINHPNIEFSQNEQVVEMSLSLNGLPAVNLEANTKYWLVVAPELNVTDFGGTTSRFNWYAATEVAGSNLDAQLITPLGAFGNAAPAWTSTVNITGNSNFKSLAFELESAELSLNNHDLISSIQIHPNPVLDILNIRLGSDFENVSYELIDINGRKLYAGKSESINMTACESGVYILNVLQDGTQVGSKKIIKK